MNSIALLIDKIIPNHILLSRHLKSPELGPNILFFSGGSSLRELSQKLIKYTHNSTHVITPFDSGGSSAPIRDAFNMISIGDLRNRLMALADQSIKGNHEIYRLFSHRLPKTNTSQNELIEELNKLIEGNHTLILSIPDPMREIICQFLNHFRRKMPSDFDLNGASIGNLVITGGYLFNNNNIDSVIYLFSKLVEAKGAVRPLTNNPLHLGVTLSDNTQIIGQHQITGKETSPLTLKVKNIFLTKSKTTYEPVHIEIDKTTKKSIKKADLICYPYGSFYSSLVVNLIPSGISPLIAYKNCPKIFIPNPKTDPEQINMNLSEMINILTDNLNAGEKIKFKPNQLINIVLLDKSIEDYPYSISIQELESYGIQVIKRPILNSNRSINPIHVIETLLSLC